MIKVEVTRNYKGFPVAARLQDGNKIVVAEYEVDKGFTITGSRRNLTPAMLELLRLIFPAPEAIKTIENIENIENIESIDLIDRLTLIDTISAITNIVNVANIQSVDLIDAITNIANLQSLDLIDRITLIDDITNIGTLANLTNVGTINLINTLTTLGTVNEITHITDIDTISEITVANVKTTGGTNILIDKLTQSAFTSRGDTLKNYTEVTAPAAPSANVSNTTYKSKFYPRGARGHLYRFAVYCKRTGAGTLTLSYSPYPGMGAIGSVVVTPGADWAYILGTVDAFWNYDSLFVWVSACSADVSYGYDTDAAGDAFTSADSGVTWSYENRRYIIAADFYGLPVGTVPVSGTINNIEIPNTGSVTASGVTSAPNITTTTILSLNGSGTVLQIDLKYNDTTAPTALGVLYLLNIIIDGGSVIQFSNITMTMSETATSGNLSHGEFYQDSVYSHIVVRLPFEFKRNLTIQAHQSTGGAVNTSVDLIYNKVS